MLFVAKESCLPALSIRLGIASGTKDIAPTKDNFPQNVSPAKTSGLGEGHSFP